MRILTLIAILACSCAASDKRVATAKQARYQGDQLVLFDAMKRATESKYKIETADQTTLKLKTLGRWHNEEGLAVSAGGPQDYQHMPDRSLFISMVVELLAVEGQWLVVVTPVVLRHLAGRPNLDPVDAKDPSLPLWVGSRAGQLQVDINDSMKTYEVHPTTMPANTVQPPAETPVTTPST